MLQCSKLYYHTGQSRYHKLAYLKYTAYVGDHPLPNIFPILLCIYTMFMATRAKNRNIFKRPEQLAQIQYNFAQMFLISPSTKIALQNKMATRYPGIQFRLPCTPPRTIFHGCQIVHWDPLDGKRRCPQKNFGLGYVKLHGFYANP